MDWGGDAPPPLIADVRAAAAPLCIALQWSTMFESKAHHAPHLMRAHINALEMEAVLLLLKRLRREGLRNTRILVYVDSRVILGALAKGRSSSYRLNHVLRKIASICIGCGFAVDFIWIPLWANPSDAPSRAATVADWRRGLPDVVFFVQGPSVAGVSSRTGGCSVHHLRGKEIALGLSS